MSLKYNLQFFAKDGPGGEKTEEATSKKLEDARKEGQVAKSKEISNGFGILGLFLIIHFFAGSIGIKFLELFETMYVKIPEFVKYWGGNLPKQELFLIFRQMLLQILLICGPVMLIALGVGVLCDLLQVKWKPSSKPLQPKLSKLDPIKGFKKIISLNSLMELVKSLAKITLILYITYRFVLKNWQDVFILYEISLNEAIILLGNKVVSLGIQISLLYLIISFADLIYQRVKFKKDMKMTKQEVKDEYKQQDGDPLIKSKIRRKMLEASQRRMMQSVPKADVVITNPTHYAVAILYDAQKFSVPMVVAKGEDYLALKIKEMAKANNVEIVENKPLARMLYANVDVDQCIPEELYQAVAEVLAFVYRAKGKV